MKRRLAAPNKWPASPRKGLMKIFTSTLLAILVAISAVAPAHAQIVEKKSLNLDGAKKAIAAAVDYAKKNNAPGGVIAIVDEGGNLMALERLDGTFAMGATISIGKARTAVLFKKPTRFFEELINKGRTAMTAVDGFTPLIGGIPIVVDGEVVGGIGVSGAASANQDEELALAGAAAFSESTKADPPSKAASANEVTGAPMMKATNDATFVDASTSLRHSRKDSLCSKPPVTKCTPAGASNPVRLRSTRLILMSFMSSMAQPRSSPVERRLMRRKSRLTKSAAPKLRAGRNIR